MRGQGLADLPTTHPLAHLYLVAVTWQADVGMPYRDCRQPGAPARRRRAHAARQVAQRQAAQARRKRQRRHAR